MAVAAVTAAVAFVFFAAIAALADEEPQTLAKAVGRAIGAIVVGAFLAIREGRREDQSLSGAVRDGLMFGGIVIVSNSLTGSEMLARELAFRSAGVLLGMPLLAVLTHVLSQKRMWLPSE